MINQRELIDLVESGWRHLPVLVVGDVMLDQYVWGDVERISPEAPVPVVRGRWREDRPGGAANVAMNLAGLGASVTLVGFAGGDREQQSLEALVTEQGIEPQLIGVTAVPTTTKLRIVSGHHQMMRLDMERNAGFAHDDHCQLINRALSALDRCAIVVLSDYAKGVFTEATCQSIIAEARRRKIPVLVDPKARSFERYRGATAICPNLKELAAATGLPANHLDRLLTAGQALVEPLQVEFLAVTLGEKGITVLTPASRLHVPAVVREVYDVSGAGDTVIAVLALAMASHRSLESATHLANLAAGIVVSKAGTAAIQCPELLAALSEATPLAMDQKVLSLEAILARVGLWRSTGQRIVFTNGCFDLLHIGHIRLLEEARGKGDRLIVGLNNDASVQRLKGPLRPVVGEHERAQVIAALSAIDAVVVFAEDTPLRLIEAIRPDVLVKGGDYTEEAVVGAFEVRAWGGRVELLPLVQGISTSRLIAAATTPPKPMAGMFSA